ncbi:unnamed protein product [Closterium sp. NIES-65]|nr:unnamed protein product [Closterium sp. NIES-65]
MNGTGDTESYEQLVKYGSMLKAYRERQRSQLQTMAGAQQEVFGEISSKVLSGRIVTRKAQTVIEEVTYKGECFAGEREVLTAASRYFTEAFAAQEGVVKEAWRVDPNKVLGVLEKEMLRASWSEEEVLAAIKQLPKGKAPGLDGLPKEFIEENWDMLGRPFLRFIKEFEASAALPSQMTTAVTILLHKKGDKGKLENYRPITLLSAAYKIVAKVLANRIKKVLPMVISEHQYGFIPGRKLADAVNVVADVVDAAAAGRADWYLLLVDFQKAYDSISRDYMFQTLERMGFPEEYVNWTKGLHDQSGTQLLINGWLGERVGMERGVRQGCPLAPYLFICAAEPLSQEIKRRRLGVWKRGIGDVAYLGYADDTTVVLNRKEQVGRACELLEEFGELSGLKVNKDKTVVVPLGKNQDVPPPADAPYPWAGKNEPQRLLGVWITPGGDPTPSWEKAADRAGEVMVKWQNQHINTSTRVTVLNSYATPILLFQAQVYPPPRGTWKEFRATSHNFTSSGKASADRHFVLWSGDLAYTSRKEGGLGVINPTVRMECSSVTARWALKAWKAAPDEWKAALLEKLTGEEVLKTTRFASTRSLAGREMYWQLIARDGDEILGKSAAVGKKGEVLLSDRAGQVRLAVHRLTPLVVENGVLMGEGGLPLTRLRTSVLCAKGKGAPLKKLRAELRGPVKQPKQQKKWEQEYGKPIDWKESIRKRDTLVTPGRAREVILRLHSKNLQVGDRLHFMRDRISCPHCKEDETLGHCLLECDSIQPVIGALKGALKQMNPTREVERLEDFLFAADGTSSGFPEKPLIAVAFHRIWLERCEAAFRQDKFQPRRVLRKIGVNFMKHVRIYSTYKKQATKEEASGAGQCWPHLARDEAMLLSRIFQDEDTLTWKEEFRSVWANPRTVFHPP